MASPSPCKNRRSPARRDDMADDVVIFVSSRAVWRVHVDPAADATEIARTVASALVGRSGDVVVAIPSAWCLVAHIEASAAAAAAHHDDHKSMMFRLEEKLPLAAEEIVADFV